jgi:hypothetical protein
VNSHTDFALPNIPDAALQHHYTKVAICGFLRRNCHEVIASVKLNLLSLVHFAGAGALPA